MSVNLAPLMEKGIAKHYGIEELLVKGRHEQLFHMGTMDGAYTDDQLWEMYEGPEPKPLLEAVTQGQFLPSFNKRYIPVTYALGDAIAEEHWEDDQYGVLKRVLPAQGGALARVFRTHKEKTAADLFATLGFGTAPVSGSPDGQPLFSTAHPMSAGDATTASNRPSTYVDLSIQSYQDMYENIVQQFAANAYDIVDNAPRVLVYNPTQRVIANQIARGEWEPGTTDRNMNVARGDAVKLVEWPYFRKTGATSATGSWNAWFVIGQTHYLKWFERKAFTLKTDYDVNTLAYVFVAFMRYVCGWTDWRGTYGSAGI